MADIGQDKELYEHFYNQANFPRLAIAEGLYLLHRIATALEKLADE